MILYHGSYVEVSKPDISHSRLNVDFGRGFYTTPILEDEALKRLQYEKPNLQICLRTQEVIDAYLIFEGSEMV